MKEIGISIIISILEFSYSIVEKIDNYTLWLSRKFRKINARIQFYEYVTTWYLFGKTFITKKEISDFLSKNTLNFWPLELKLPFLIILELLFFSGIKNFHLLIYMIILIILIINIILYLKKFREYIKPSTYIVDGFFVCNSSYFLVRRGLWESATYRAWYFSNFYSNQNTKKSFSSRTQAKQFACLGSQIKKPLFLEVF